MHTYQCLRATSYLVVLYWHFNNEISLNTCLASLYLNDLIKLYMLKHDHVTMFIIMYIRRSYIQVYIIKILELNFHLRSMKYD